MLTEQLESFWWSKFSKPTSTCLKCFDHENGLDQNCSRSHAAGSKITIINIFMYVMMSVMNVMTGTSLGTILDFILIHILVHLQNRCLVLVLNCTLININIMMYVDIQNRTIQFYGHESKSRFVIFMFHFQLKVSTWLPWGSISNVGARLWSPVI